MTAIAHAGMEQSPAMRMLADAHVKSPVKLPAPVSHLLKVDIKKNKAKIRKGDVSDSHPEMVEGFPAECDTATQTETSTTTAETQTTDDNNGPAVSLHNLHSHYTIPEIVHNTQDLTPFSKDCFTRSI